LSFGTFYTATVHQYRTGLWGGERLATSEPQRGPAFGLAPKAASRLCR